MFINKKYPDHQLINLYHNITVANHTQHRSFSAQFIQKPTYLTLRFYNSRPLPTNQVTHPPRILDHSQVLLNTTYELMSIVNLPPPLNIITFITPPRNSRPYYALIIKGLMKTNLGFP